MYQSENHHFAAKKQEITNVYFILLKWLSIVYQMIVECLKSKLTVFIS